MIATWGESEESDSQDESEKKESADLCLMAQKNEIFLDSFTENTTEELEVAFADLLFEFEKLSSKYRIVENKNLQFSEECSRLTKSNDSLVKKNYVLSKELNRLKPIVDKFTLSSEK